MERTQYLPWRMERGYVDDDNNGNDHCDCSKYNNSRTNSSSSDTSPGQFIYNTVISALANESSIEGAASK
eukprot:10803897-Ditylum_brightwellii.AAC.1